jgi:AraC family transcriptional regulator of adaptative response / methylphosphotriester-DNA alkyltransferase methyltransferase
MSDTIKTISRSEEITLSYFNFLNQHIESVVSGDTPEFLQLNEIAGELCISHQHLTDTVQKQTGNHPCYFYDLKIIEHAQLMLKDPGLSVAEVAKILTYDPSNFGKFFKKIVGETPKTWRTKRTG